MRVVRIKMVNLYELISEREDLSSFHTFVDAAGLKPTLTRSHALTIFAPSNAAFNQVSSATRNGLLKDKTALKNVIQYHLMEGKVRGKDLKTNATPLMKNGKNLCIFISDGTVRINGAYIVKDNIEASNGLIHIIDQVLIFDDQCKRSFK
jgi:uncharacterized surface protein with fasciclin (FAS1) repeats